jgi:hypothetical protein
MQLAEMDGLGVWAIADILFRYMQSLKADDTGGAREKASSHNVVLFFDPVEPHNLFGC